MSTAGNWGAHAASLAPLPGDGWFSVTLPATNAGQVAVGLVSDAATSRLADILHGFHAERTNAQRWRTLTSTQQGPAHTYSGDIHLHLLRFAGTLYYLVGDTPTSHPDVPFALPGTVVATRPAPSGTLHLKAFIYLPEDEVLDLRSSPANGAALSLAPLTLYSLASDTAYAHLSFAHSTLTAIGHRLRSAQASLALAPLQHQASQTESAQAALSLSPLQLSADHRSAHASLSVRPMSLEASQAVPGRVALSLPAARIHAAEALDYVGLRFAPLQILANERPAGHARLSLRPLSLHANTHTPTQAALHLSPLILEASAFATAPTHGARLTFPPLTQRARSDEPPYGYAGLIIPPLRQIAAQDTTYSSAALSTPPLFMRSGGGVFHAVLVARLPRFNSTVNGLFLTLAPLTLESAERLTLHARLTAPDGRLRAVAFNDWAAAIDPLTAQHYFGMEIILNDLRIRIPISSWQATAQLDRASYLQCVVPAAGQWMESILEFANQGGYFTIHRGARFADGSTHETGMITAPLQIVTADEGPTNFTATLSGYTHMESPGESPTRPLTGIRSRSSGNSLRIRCALDWFLRPGMSATDGQTTFTVGYINYYVNRNDAYMDVGDRRNG